MLRKANGANVSALGALILGQIYSFAKEGKACSYGYKNFVERLHVSRATVARQVSQITKRADITAERNGGKPTTYTTSFELGDGAYIDLPLWITTPFSCTYWEDGKKEVTETVTLTPSEQLVLAMIYTETKQLDKKGKKAIEASPATISAKLQKIICTRTVKAALLRLAKFGLITREKVAVNAHGEGLGGYKADLSKFKAILSARRRAERRAKKELEKAQRKLSEVEAKLAEIPKKAKKAQEIAIEAANVRADRDRYYALRRDVAERSAEKYKNAAYLTAPKLKELDIALSKCELDVARAEIFAPQTLSEATERKRRLEAERAALLSRFGIEAERLDARYYTCCKVCYDTGERSDGTGCDCWKNIG